jgi:hypothetical protein
MARLIIEVDFEDDSEFDYNRARLVASVEEEVEEMKEQKRIVEGVEVSWDTGD